MSKKTYIFIVVGVVVLAGALVGGWYWRKQANEKKQTIRKAQISKPLGSSSGSSSISLNDSPSDLSVESGNSAVNLGQLDSNNNQSDSPVESNTKKVTSPFDPTTFGQYEQYKNGTSGLFAEVQKGTGAELVAGKKAGVYYKGWLTNGQLFDQSVADAEGKMQPFVFTMGGGQVIPGWEQAMYGMKVGGVRLLIVPPAVGYKDKGQGPIPPNAVLIFQVQLAAVE